MTNTTSPTPIPQENPIAWLQTWIDDATAAHIPDANAMTVSTVDHQGWPSSRVVLLKGLDAQGLVFYTNRTSQKGRDLTQHPHAAAVFYWHALSRQVRVRGAVSWTSDAESDAYFASRPRDSRLGAWASLQGQVLPDRETFDARLSEVTLRYAAQDHIPRPPHWGGYRIAPVEIEFWIGHPFRWHDRYLYTRQPDQSWAIQQLYP